MKKRKRSRIPSRTLYCFQKRLLAFLLAAAMILANVGADTNQVYAASSSESVTFSMGGSQLIKAIEDAIINGDEVTAQDLDFTNGKIAEFKELFFGKGKIYEAFPELEGEGVDAQLRVFVRIPENADDMYMVTGEEEIVFLYVNNGDNTISCSTEITRMDDGVEKVKKTNRITVRSYESAFGKEDVNVVTNPEQTTVTGETKVPETATPAEAEKVVETAPSKEATAAEETTIAPEETLEKLPEETTVPPEEETVKEAADSEEIPVSENQTAEPVASIIRHNAPVVAAKENSQVVEATEVSEETAAADPENKGEPKETEAAAQVETAEVETAESETAEAETAEVETTQAETSQAETAQAEITQAETTQVETTQAETSHIEATKTAVETASPSESKPAPEIPDSETKATPAGTGDLVGMGYCSTAKAYTITINQLKALDDYDGYKISYTINPEASARIIDGARGVEEGQELTFGVKNQIGYGIESVTANEQTLKSDSITDNDDGSQTTWYSVPEIYEDQEIEVHMTETGEHPEFSSQLDMKDGMVIRLYAPEGVLPAGVKASAVVVTGIGDAVKEKVEAQAKAEGVAKEVIGSLSYNIDLLDRSGNKLDNQIWNGAVQVTFSGTPMEEHSKEADTVEVVYVATTNEDEPEAKVKAEDVTSVEPVSEELNVQENKGINEITFEAEHFSTYTIIFNNIFVNNYVLLNVVKYDKGAAVPIGTDAVNNVVFDSYTSTPITDIAPNVSGYTFVKATVGENYDSGEVIQYLVNETDLWKNTLKYKTASSNWKKVNSSIYLWYSENGITVQFNSNGGSGTVPSQNAKPGDVINLPNGTTLTRPNYRFMGWSESPDGGKITAKGNAGYNEVYTDTFTIKENETANAKTLYAVWAQDSGNAKGRLWIAVLSDGGDLPAEPRNQTNRSYQFIYNDNGKSYKTIGNGDNLLNYITPLITVTGKDNVQANLNNKFYQVIADWETKNLESNEYIEWYVIKYESEACGTEGWHVDGIIRNNKSFYVDYAGNGNTGGLTPDGHKYNLNSDVVVAEAGGYESGNWIPLKKDGYVFNGWNTRSDGSGVAFKEGSSFKLTQEFLNANHSATENTVTLYAQWKLKNSVQINYLAVGEGSVSPSSENLNPDIGISKGATASPNRGYKLSGWYSDAGCKDQVSTDETYTPIRPATGWLDGTTYYAEFVVDDAQKFNYTVNFLIYGTTAPVPGLTAQTGSAPVGEFTWTNVLKTTTGYKLMVDQPESMTITAAGTNESTVYYEIDEDQKFNYTVNYLIKGTTTEVPGLTAQTGSAPVGTFTWENEPKTTTGYKLMECQPASMTITAAGPNEKTVYYEIDDEQKFGYKVNYLIKGTSTPVPGLTALTGSVPVGTFTWENEPKTTTGYKLMDAQPTSMTITAAGPNEITVFYEIDNDQKFGYKVNFLIEGTTASVPGLKALTGSAPVGDFTWENEPETTTGYKLMAEQPTSMTITAGGNNERTVYYEIDEAQKFNYTVDYLIKETTTKVPGLTALTGSAPVGTFTWENEPKTTTGYKLMESQPASMTITAAGPNRKSVYYEIDNEQKFGYKVNYLIKGTSTPVPGLTTLTGSEPVGTFTWTNATNTTTGYKLMAAQPTSMTITAAGPNEKTVYYEIDKNQRFSYTVNYLIKGTSDPVPGLTTLTGSAAVGEITWINTPKTKTGYKLMAAQPTSMIITAAGPNEKTVYYEIDNAQIFGYKVNYLIKGSTDPVPGLTPLTGRKPVGDFSWTNVSATTTGYKLMDAQPTSMTITAAGPNETTVYYEIDDAQKFSYTVNYLIKGTTTPVPGLTTLTGKAPVGEFTWTNEPKTTTGYKLMANQPSSMIITSAGSNQKKVYYEIDNGQNFNYTVNFLIKESTTSVPGLTPLTGSTHVGKFTWTNAPKTTTGYKLMAAQPTSMTITAAGPNEMTVYYEIDKNQNFSYKVNYYINGTTAPVPGLSPLTGKAWVGEFTWTNEPKTETGYKLMADQPESMTITAAGPNEKTVYYEIDEAQRFDYRVNYYIKDTTTAVPGLETLTGKESVGTFTWINEPKTETGYKLMAVQPTSMTITSEGPNEKTVYYEIDESQIFDYTVNHLIKGTTTAVPGLNDLTGSAPVGGITWTNALKTTTGYRLMADQPESMIITAAGPNKKTVYYEIDESQNFDYRVNYYIKDTTTAVPGLDALSSSAPVGEFTWTNAPKTETGYKLMADQPTSMTITAAGPNEKTVYYEIDESQSFDYRVNYYIKDTTTAVPGLDALSSSAPVGEVTWTNAPKTETGYKLMADQPTSMTITAAGPNEKTVYYEIDESQNFDYRVNYYIKDTTTAVPGLDALSSSAPVGEFTWTNAPKTETGYKLMADQPTSMTITAAGPNEKTVYYEIDESQNFDYRVNYYIKDTTTAVPGLDALSSSAPVGEFTWTNAPKTETGYKLMADQPTSMTITAAGPNEKTVYYEIDESQNFDYRVNYYIKDTTTAVPGLDALSSSAPVGEFTWTNASKTETGYKLMTDQPTSMTITAAGPNEKTVYYEIDESQNFDYRVNYYIKDTTTAVPGLDALSSSAPVGEFTWTNASKTETGYKLMADQPTSMTITAAGPNEKTVYYEIDESQNFDYRVNYYIKDTTTAVPGLDALSSRASVGEVTWTNTSKTETGYKLMADQPTSMTITAAGPNEKTVYYEIDEDQTLTYKIKYFYNNSEDPEAEENQKVLVADPTVNQVTLKEKAGYKLSDKPYNPELPAVITEENNVINVYYDPVQVNYIVDLYYQENGDYTEQPTYSYTRNGYTESMAEVTADDRQIKKSGYVFDEAKENVLGGAIAGDGSLVLKVYFKQQFTVTYTPGTQGTFATQKVEGLDYNTVTPEYDGTPTGKPGYVFAGWSPKLEPVVTTDNTYVAQWISSTATKYTVEFYYQSQGKYPEQANNSSLRAGTTDALAAVTDSDKTASSGYILDTNAANVFEAAVTGDGGMVLRVYFKQQFTITYNPGVHGSFVTQTNTGLSYGDAVPAFEGQTTANGNYRFIGWNKEITETVSESVVYTALWSYNGGGSSGGSSGGGPSATGTRQAGGPGDTTVTIDPVPVPLANLPENTNLVTIDDGNIPLAGLPKTGDRAPIQGVAAIVSGILLAAYLAISHKRRDER